MGGSNERGKPFAESTSCGSAGAFPTISLQLILRTESVMSVGFEKAFLPQNDLNLHTSEGTSAYAYKYRLAG